MLKKFRLLQIFAEGGGDGGSSAGEGSGEAGSGVAESLGNSKDDAIYASLPEKAKNAYKKAVEKNRPNVAVNTPTKEADVKPSKPSYADLIKSDDYKEEHKAYMEKTISDRFKRYKGIEESNAKMQEVLSTVAKKYDLNPSDEGFLEAITQKINEDDSYYEQYAMDHDISVDEAKRNLALEAKVKKLEAEEKARKDEAARNEHWNALLKNAEKTKARFPGFDLETQMQNEEFRRLCALLHEDTTAAYMALNWNREVPGQIQAGISQAQIQISNSVASNMNRPIENGLSSQASAIVTPGFKGMSKSELKAWAEEHRKR